MPEQESMGGNRWTAMTTEELEQLLQDDWEQNCLREQDLVEISAVLAQREPPEADVGEAWAEFCSQYRPEAGEETGLEELTDGMQDGHAATWDTSKTKARFPRRAVLWAAELAAVAAVFAAVTLTGRTVPAAEPQFPDAQISAALNRQVQEQEEQSRTASDGTSAPENTQSDVPYDTTDYGERSLGGNSRQTSGTAGSAPEDEDTVAIMAMDLPEEEGSGSGEQAEDPAENPNDGEDSVGAEPEAPADPPPEPSVGDAGESGTE